MSKNNQNKVYVSKRIDDYALYMYADIFDILKIVLDGHVSEETSKQLYDVSAAIHKEIGHLKCGEYTDFCVIERGFNYRNKE